MRQLYIIAHLPENCLRALSAVRPVPAAPLCWQGFGAGQSRPQLE